MLAHILKGLVALFFVLVFAGSIILGCYLRAYGHPLLGVLCFAPFIVFAIFSLAEAL